MCCNTLSRRWLLLIAALGLVIGVGQFVMQYAQADHHAEGEATQAASDAQAPAVLDFTVQSIEGEDVYLGRYYGDVVLIVNTASRCGLTPQYEQLQALHEEYADQGLSILGFPANNFGRQEPGTNDQILEFCEQNYGVDFDMFAKVSVKGDDIVPLYAYLTSEETNGDFAGEIRWNFDKFLVNRNGEVVARFAPRTRPDSEEVIAAIEAALAQPAPADAPSDETEAEAQ